MIRRITLLLALLLTVSVFAGEAKWWNTAWKSRKLVRVTLPTFTETPGFEKLAGEVPKLGRLTLRAAITRETPSTTGHDDVRVVDAKGNVLPRRIYSFGNETAFKVVFPGAERSADYYIYYDNPKPEPMEKSSWLHGTKAMHVVSVKHKGEKRTFELDHVIAGLRAGVEPMGDTWTSGIQALETRRAPGEQRSYDPGQIISYEGYLLCPIAGRYTFSINYRGGSYLFVDGKLTVEARALYPTPHTWPQPNNVVLKAGYHHIRLLLVKESRGGSVGLGWQMPGMEYIEAVGKYFYARYVDAEVVALEKQGANDTVFFTHKLPPEAINLWHELKQDGPLVNFPGYNADQPKPTAVAYTKFLNRGTLAADDGVTWQWTIQRVQKARDASGKSVMVLAPEPNTFETTDASPAVFLQVGESYRATLKGMRGGKEIGTYMRRIDVDEPKSSPRYTNVIYRTIEKPTIRLEVLSAPNIVYAGEENNAAFRVVTNLNYPVPVDWSAWITRGNQRVNNQTGSFFGGTGEDVVMTFPLRLDDFPERRGSMTVALAVHNTETNRVEFDIEPSPGDFSDLDAPRGFFVNKDGRRVVICTTYENEADYRRWMFIKAIGRAIDTSKKDVLIFGSPMTNAPESGREAVGYVDHFKAAMKGKVAGITFVQRATGISPILKDVITMSRRTADKTPQVAVIVPGLDDADSGASRQDFERGLDVLIDLLRAKGDYVNIVLVTPPPLVSNPELSELYAEDIREIARKHHTGIADVHKTMMKSEQWRDAYRISPGAQVFNLYPNDATQRLIADLIAAEL